MSNALTLLCRCGHPRGEHVPLGVGLPAKCTGRWTRLAERWPGDTEPCPCPHFHPRKKEPIDDQ